MSAKTTILAWVAKLNAWMQDDQVATQPIHFALAFIPLDLFVRATHSWHVLLVWSIVAFVLAALKEFLWDSGLTIGERDSWSDSAMDFAFYCVGIGAQWIVTYVLAVFGREGMGA
jgi:hypothetical protein